MTNEEKLEAIRPWIDPEERVTVDFLDQQGLNAEVTACNDVISGPITRNSYTAHQTTHIDSTAKY